jgi:beta-phosphoglucomutase
MIRGFFFDLDGTLVDTYQADYLAYHDAIKEVLDLEIAAEDFIKTHGQELRQKLKLLAPGTSDEDIRKIADSKKGYYQKYLHLTVPNNELIQFLANFAEHHAMVIVTTAKRKNALSVIKKHDLEKYFSHMVFGDEISNPKPHPEAYLLALEKSGLKPEQVLAFEDSESGIAAAEAAGIAVVYVRTFT